MFYPREGGLGGDLGVGPFLRTTTVLVLATAHRSLESGYYLPVVLNLLVTKHSTTSSREHSLIDGRSLLNRTFLLASRVLYFFSPRTQTLKVVHARHP